jgi:hypothetical protein
MSSWLESLRNFVGASHSDTAYEKLPDTDSPTGGDLECGDDTLEGRPTHDPALLARIQQFICKTQGRSTPSLVTNVSRCGSHTIANVNGFTNIKLSELSNLAHAVNQVCNLATVSIEFNTGVISFKYYDLETPAFIPARPYICRRKRKRIPSPQTTQQTDNAMRAIAVTYAWMTAEDRALVTRVVSKAISLLGGATPAAVNVHPQPRERSSPYALRVTGYACITHEHLDEIVAVAPSNIGDITVDIQSAAFDIEVISLRSATLIDWV